MMYEEMYKIGFYNIQYLTILSVYIECLKKNIHTVATGMLGSLPRCSTTLFTMVETVEGVTVVGAREEGMEVVALMV